MIPLAPPYGLAPRSFGFAQLAAFAGRATLGATRETALACLIGARLVVAMTPPFRNPRAWDCSAADSLSLCIYPAGAERSSRNRVSAG